ncbi:GNAT family N-acetyltransferase [Actinopolymorpha alba]|uniref:GNAT family N-acetyltransferase n=1 Tax=Actinopolymorpha alba TaxID=533267 RepID=UPI003B502F8B
MADYLVACLPSGQVIGKGGVDYEPVPGAGALWQFAVLEPLQSCGIGSALIRECERRIQGRGLRWAGPRSDLRRVDPAAEPGRPPGRCQILAAIPRRSARDVRDRCRDFPAPTPGRSRVARRPRAGWGLSCQCVGNH